MADPSEFSLQRRQIGGQGLQGQRLADLPFQKPETEGALECPKLPHLQKKRVIIWLCYHQLKDSMMDATSMFRLNQPFSYLLFQPKPPHESEAHQHQSPYVSIDLEVELEWSVHLGKGSNP